MKNKLVMVSIEYSGKPIRAEFIREFQHVIMLDRKLGTNSYHVTSSSHDRLLAVLGRNKAREYMPTVMIRYGTRHE